MDGGRGLEGILQDRRAALVGIVNGCDYGEWDPATDAMIPSNYSVDELAGKVMRRLALASLLLTLPLLPLRAQQDPAEAAKPAPRGERELDLKALGARPLPTPFEQSANLSRGDLIVMWTDGVAGLPGALTVRDAFRPAQELADDIVASRGRSHDDAGCIVLRWEP